MEISTFALRDGMMDLEGKLVDAIAKRSMNRFHPRKE